MFICGNRREREVADNFMSIDTDLGENGSSKEK